MRTQLLWAAGVLVLLITVDGALAQGQDQNQVQRAAPRRVVPPPVRMPGRPMDSNELGRREQRRQQMLEQKQERSSRPRRPADQNVAPDANVLAREKRRYEPGGRSKDVLTQKAAASGEQYKQQLKAVEQQLTQEEAKHRERVARLSRIRELAQQQGNTETVTQVDKLIEKEQKQYEIKTQRLERRKNAITKFMEKAAADPPSGEPQASRPSSRGVSPSADKNKSGADADTNKP